MSALHALCRECSTFGLPKHNCRRATLLSLRHQPTRTTIGTDNWAHTCRPRLKRERGKKITLPEVVIRSAALALSRIRRMTWFVTNLTDSENLNFILWRLFLSFRLKKRVASVFFYFLLFGSCTNCSVPYDCAAPRYVDGNVIHLILSTRCSGKGRVAAFGC